MVPDAPVRLHLPDFLLHLHRRARRDEGRDRDVRRADHARLRGRIPQYPARHGAGGGTRLLGGAGPWRADARRHRGLPCLVFVSYSPPPSVPPGWGQALGKAIPLPYWFDIIRRILMPQSMLDLTASTTMESFGLGEVLLLLLVSATLFFFLSVGLFRLMEWLARRSGKLDMTTAY